MVSNSIEIRNAELADADFLAAAIIESEKGGTRKSGMASLFCISEMQLRQFLKSMLEEELDGCEFSIGSFMLAEIQGRPVATAAAWAEALGDAPPSILTKANLIGYTFPKEALAAMRANAHIMKGLSISREIATMQVEYVYVHPDVRGHGLAKRLINENIHKHRTTFPEISKAQLQLFGNNIAAKRLYESMGFSVVMEYNSNDENVMSYFPCNTKLLMEKTLQ